MAGTASEKREYHEDTVKWAKVGNVVKIPYTRSGLGGLFILIPSINIKAKDSIYYKYITFDLLIGTFDWLIYNI